MRTFRFVLAAVLATAGLSVVVAPPAAYGAASVGTFDQCVRGTPITSCSGWTGGNLTSGYTEDMVVPQRVELQVTSAGTYTFSTTYDDLAGSGHVIDYLASWDYTQDTADPCAPTYAAALCSGTPSTFPMASDGAARGPVVAGYDNTVASHELPQADRQWTLYGGTITGVSPIAHASGTGSASVTFTTTGPGTAILLFGAHLALTGPSSDPRAWPAGASTVNGNAQLAASIGGNKTHNIKVGNATPPPPPAAFTISKSVAPTSAAPGQQVGYTVTVTNTGGQAGSTTFTDNYDNALTNVGTPAGCTQGAGQMTCTTDVLEPAASQDFVYTANLPATFSDAGTGCPAGQYAVRNTATLANNTPAGALVCVTAAPQFTVSKDAAATAGTGETVEYEITVTNTGDAAGSTTLTDTFDVAPTPASVTALEGQGCTVTASSFSCPTGVLAAGATATYTYSSAMPDSFSSGTTCGGGYLVSNTASLSTGGSATHNVCVQTAPAFSVTKTADAESVVAGGTVEYTVTVTNTGTSPGSTSFTDDHDDRVVVTAPNGCTDDSDTLVCATGELGPGASQVFTYTATMPGTFSGGDEQGDCGAGAYLITNDVAVPGDTASADVCVSTAPAFGVTKEATPAIVGPNGEVEYTIVVTNSGTGPGSTNLVDTYDGNVAAVTTMDSDPDGNDCTAEIVLPNTFVCETAVLDPGASQTFTYTATMPASFPADHEAGQNGCTGAQHDVHNGVSVTGAAAEATVCVNAAPGFAIVKKSSESTVEPGDEVTYTVTVTNTGTAAGSPSFTDTSGATITSTPDECDLADDVLTCSGPLLGAGESHDYVYTADVPESFTGDPDADACEPPAYPVVNTAVLSGGAGAEATVCVGAGPDLVLSKSVDEDEPELGDTITYTVTVTNEGSAPGSTTFTDDYDDRLTLSNIPAGCTDDAGVLQCTTGSIAADGSESFEYDATLPETVSGDDGGEPCGAGSYRFTNDVTAVGGASASQDICVPASAEFTIAKAAGEDSVSAGGAVTYTITVTNTGDAAGSTSFTDDYDDRVVPGEVTTDPDETLADCADQGGTLSCTTGTILAGESQTFTYTASMPASFDAEDEKDGDCYPVTNRAGVGDQFSDATVCVTAEPAFTIVKSANTATAAPGQGVQYTVTVTNDGTANGSTTFTDDYADGVSVTVPDGCTDDGDVLTCATDDLDPLGGSQDFVYTGTMPSSFGADAPQGDCGEGSYAIDNTATLAGDVSDGATVCVAADARFLIEKDADPAAAVPGGTVHYTITVTNTGDAAGSTSFTDDYDDRLTPAVPDGCTPVPDESAFSCTTGTIPVGQSETFEYDAVLPATFGTNDGAEGCAPGTFRVRNAAALPGDGPADDAVVCVTASPSVSIDKDVDDSEAGPGQTVEYTITVSNSGDAASPPVTFTDHYAGGLTDVTLPDGCTAGAGSFTCTTEVIPAGGDQVFTYAATLPAAFDGGEGDGDCGPGTYPVVNEVTSGEEGPGDSVLICSPAAPVFEVGKSVDVADVEPGDTVTYTVVVTNTGNASGSTSFVDDYDELIDPSVPDGCVKVLGTLSCTTGTILAGESQAFTYSATVPETFTGESGGGDCSGEEFRISNGITETNGAVAAQDVCVAASPEFEVAKSVEEPEAAPGQTVHYTVTVSNVGDAAGAATIVDDHDPRLTDLTVPEGCVADIDASTLTCSTGTVEAGSSVEFEYSATIPETFTGPSGTHGCPTGSYGVVNTVTVVDGEATASAPVCVAASPNVSVTKSDSLDVEDDGDQMITYTIDYTNTGAAEALDVVVSDPVPNGTTFVSCTGGCTVVDGTATWPATGIAPAGGTGSVTLVVQVTSNQTCLISNTAQVEVGSAPAISSNTVTTPVTPAPDTANAKSNGSAIGLSVQTNGLLNLIGPLVGAAFTNNNTMTLSNASSSRTGPGAPSLGSDQVLSVKLPGNGSLLRTGLISTTSMSTVTQAPAETRSTSVSEVAGVCLVPVAGVCTVEASAVRAVASTMANGGFAAVSTAGSTITNLKVVNTVVPVDLNTSVTIPLPAAVFGKNSYVAINEKTGTAGLKGGKYVADQSVAMIHVKITGLLLGVQAAEIYVGKATAHSEFPKTFVCEQVNTQAVSGHAFLARLYAGWILNNDNLTVGYAQISPLGGAEDEHVLDVKIPRYGVIADAQVGDTHSAGGFTGSTSAAQSWAELAGDGDKPLCVLSYVTDCVVKATAIRSEARSVATAAGSTSTDLGTNFVGLKVLGIPISGTPRPNTVIPLPGIGFVILNEQFCDNGSYTSGACSGPAHSGLTVRAVRVVITVANNLLGLTPGVELVLSEAHADSTFS